MKRLNKTESPIFVFCMFFVTKGNVSGFYLNENILEAEWSRSTLFARACLSQFGEIVKIHTLFTIYTYYMGRVKRKGAFEHVENVQSQVILRIRIV